MTEATTTIARPRSRLALQVGLPTAIILLLHASSLWLPMFADDYLFFDSVRGKSLIGALASVDPLGNFFRPVSRQLYFWLLQITQCDTPLIVHSVNILSVIAINVLTVNIVTHLAGRRAAIIGALFVAQHYCWDVTILWASGTQDLFAIVSALIAIILHRNGRIVLAITCYAVGLLCKELVVLLPLITVAQDRALGASWGLAARRNMGYVIPFALWFPLWLRVMSSRGALGEMTSLEPMDAVAAFAHLVQVLAGIEVGPLRPTTLSSLIWAVLIGLVVVLGCWAALRRRFEHTRETPTLASVMIMGVTWTVVATLPVTAVAGIWSAYYYCFAVCGAAVCAGALLARARPQLAIVVVVLAVLGSAFGRANGSYEVPVDKWSGASHITPYYVIRATTYISSLQASLSRHLPSIPSHSTVYFGQVPGAIAWQVADGPYLRWAYRDQTVRSYFLSELVPREEHPGPVYLFVVEADTLRSITTNRSALLGLALRELGQEHWRTGIGALDFLIDADPTIAHWPYLRGWALIAAGDEKRGYEALSVVAAGVRERSDLARWTGSQHSTDGVRNVADATFESVVGSLSAEAHRRAFDELARAGAPREALFAEGLAGRVLAPDDPDVLHRWAIAQSVMRQFGPALLTLEISRGRGLPDSLATDFEARLRVLSRMAHATGSTEGQAQLD